MHNTAMDNKEHLMKTFATLALFALIGILLAWRG